MLSAVPAMPTLFCVTAPTAPETSVPWPTVVSPSYTCPVQPDW